MNTRRYSWLASLVVSVLALTATAVWGTPGDAASRTTIPVTHPTDSWQIDPTAALGPGGVSAVLWEDSRRGIQGRLFAADGTPGPIVTYAANVTPPIPGDGPASLQHEPAVAFLPSGDLLVAWASERGHLSVVAFHQDFDVTERRVMVQRFQADGTPVGPAREISGIAGRFESWPRLHVVRGGAVLAAWRSDERHDQNSGDGPGDGLFVRHLDRRARPVGSTARLSAPGDAEAQYVTFAQGPKGQVLLGWEGCCDAGGDLGIYVRSYEAAGRTFGEIRQVNVATAEKQRRPSIAADAERGYLVVWQGIVTRTEGHVYGRFVGLDGAGAGGQFQVSDGHGPVQVAPAIAVAPGGYVAVWRDWVGVAFGVSAQRLDGAGLPLGDPVRISDGKTQKNGRTYLASDGSGDYVIPWEVGYGSRSGVVASRFHLD